MKKVLWVIACVAALITSCDDNTLQLGYSIVPSVDEVIVGTGTFKVTSKTVVVDSVVAQNGYGYLGRMRDRETNAYVTADFLSQFNVIEGMTFDNPDSIVSRDSEGNIVSDTSFVSLFIGDYYGDSLNQMQLTCYELAKPLEEDRAYYSNFDIEHSGFIRPQSEGGIEKTVTWSVSNMLESDTIRSEKYGKTIFIPLSCEYTARDGKKYKNYSSYVFRMAFEHPEYFKNAYEFIHNVCPGFYFKTTNSIGTMAQIMLSQLMMSYKYKITDDSVSNRYVTLYGTEEVMQLSKVENDKNVLNKLLEDKTCTYIKTPAGLFTELSLPIDEIFSGHERDSINTAEITLQRINNENKDKYALKAPSKLLLVETDSIRQYFEFGSVSDGERSYISDNNDRYNTYSFNNISELITALYSNKQQGIASDPDWVAKHPNWNKVTLIPVEVTTNSSGIVTEVCHDMSMKSVRLVGGDDNNHEPIMMKVVYSKFNSEK